YHRAERDPLGQRGGERERGVALQHRLLRGAHPADLEEVVHHPQRVEARLVRLAGRPAEDRADPLRSAGEGEAGDLKADAHGVPLLVRVLVNRRVPTLRSGVRSRSTETPSRGPRSWGRLRGGGRPRALTWS